MKLLITDLASEVKLFNSFVDAGEFIRNYNWSENVDFERETFKDKVAIRMVIGAATVGWIAKED